MDQTGDTDLSHTDISYGRYYILLLYAVSVISSILMFHQCYPIVSRFIIGHILGIFNQT